MRTVSHLLGGAQLLGSPRFDDPRGTFAIPYEAEAATALGLPERFVQDNHSISRLPGTIRGIHLQLPPFEQGKLVRVLRGRIFDVVVDLRPDSPTVGQMATVELSGDEPSLLWVPRGFGHAFCTLETDTEVFYKVDAPYRPEAELSVAWNDPGLAIEWPVDGDEAVLSDKDRMGLSLTEALEAIDSALEVVDGGRPKVAPGGPEQLRSLR